MSNISQKIRRSSSFQLITFGFAGVILIGAILLMLPISSKSGEFTSFLDTLFTSTSCVCVTGLIVRDTATYWSYFGQAVIILLIQIGGLGIVSVATIFIMLSGRRISLFQRTTIVDAISGPQVGGIVTFLKFTLKITFGFELLGFLVMLPTMVKGFGVRGIWMSFFHSISAFCNAGFDLMGTEEAKYVSLTTVSSEPMIILPLAFLIIFGGLGFLTWRDIITHKSKFHNYRLQSKVILVTTLALIIIPTLIFFFVDYSDCDIGQRLLNSFFQSVTPRTAGFNSTNLSAMSSLSRVIMICLMLIGGAPGSTAGGMKVTTIALTFQNIKTMFQRRKYVSFFQRRIDDSTVKNAFGILSIYITLAMTGAGLISMIEKISFGTCLYETASAIATVGLTLGITQQIGSASKIILILLMYLGRIGTLTFVFSMVQKKSTSGSQYPLENVTIG